MPERKGWFGSKGAVQPKPKPLLPPPPLEVYMPEGINFSELWRDEEAPPTSLPTILAIVNTVLLALILILGFFHL